MKLMEARDLVLDLILAGLPSASGSLIVDTASPDGDPGKFMIGGKVARAIHHFDGWYAPINLRWFVGSYDPMPAALRRNG